MQNKVQMAINPITTLDFAPVHAVNGKVHIELFNDKIKYDKKTDKTKLQKRYEAAKAKIKNKCQQAGTRKKNRVLDFSFFLRCQLISGHRS